LSSEKRGGKKKKIQRTLTCFKEKGSQEKGKRREGAGRFSLQCDPRVVRGNGKRGGEEERRREVVGGKCYL